MTVHHTTIDSFVSVIKQKALDSFGKSFAYNVPCVLWDEEWYFEKISTEERIAIKTEDILHSSTFWASVKGNFYGLELEAKGHTLFIKPYLNSDITDEQEQLYSIMSSISILYHSHTNAKASVFLDGILLMRPDRIYCLAFVNEDEFCIHSYQKLPTGEKGEPLFYMFVNCSQKLVKARLEHLSQS